MNIDDKFVSLIKSGDYKVEGTVTGRLPVGPQVINFDLADDQDKTNYCIAHAEGDHVVIDHVGTVTSLLAANVSNKAISPKISDLDFSGLEESCNVTVRILKERPAGGDCFYIEKRNLYENRNTPQDPKPRNRLLEIYDRIVSCFKPRKKRMTVDAALRQAIADLSELDPVQLRAEIDKHKEGPVARALNEAKKSLVLSDDFFALAEARAAQFADIASVVGSPTGRLNKSAPARWDIGPDGKARRFPND